MKKRDVQLTTQAHRPAFDDFTNAMRSAEAREGWRSSEVLRHFLDAGFRALRGRLLVGESFDGNEAEYMKIVKACRHPLETMTDLSVMLGATGRALITEPVDFLGPVFTQLSADPGWGQVFTPYHVSYMMAKMILGDVKAQLADRPYITLSEPACGVGGMVLAANAALRDAGLDVARQAHWWAQDIDYRAMSAAYIQLALTDCSAIVAHGDTLRLEIRMKTATPAACLFPKTFEIREAPALPQVAPASTIPPTQLTLL